MAKTSVVLLAVDPGVSAVICRVDPAAAELIPFFRRWASPFFSHAGIVAFLLFDTVAWASQKCPTQHDWVNLVFKRKLHDSLWVSAFTGCREDFVISSAHEVVPDLLVVPLLVGIAFAEGGVHSGAAPVGLHIIRHNVLAFTALDVSIAQAIDERDGCARHALAPPVLVQADRFTLALEVFLGKQLTAVLGVLCKWNTSDRCCTNYGVLHSPWEYILLIATVRLFALKYLDSKLDDAYRFMNLFW